MKINPIVNPNILQSYAVSKPAPAKQKPGSALDQVTFSDEALSFSKALEEARGAIETRTPEEQKHIEEVKGAISQGTYRIESEKIADKILESVFRR